MKPMHNLLYQTMSARTSRLREVCFRKPDPIRLLTFWSLLGVGLGTMLTTAYPSCTEHFWLTQGLLLSDASRSLSDVLRTALCPLLILLTSIWLSGFSAFGQPAALFLLLLRGAAFGISAGACFSAYPLPNAICICMVLILPYSFCSIVLLSYAARDAMRLSCRMTGCLLHGQAAAEENAGDRLSTMLACLLLALLAGGMHTCLLWLFNDMLLA